MDDASETVYRIIQASKTPISFDDIIKELGDESQHHPSTVRKVLRELEENRRLISYPENIGSTGRPRLLYATISNGVMSEPIYRDTIEVQREKTLLHDLVDESTGRYSFMPPEERRRIFRETSVRLLSENPKDLFFRFAEWLKEQHEAEVELYIKAKNSKIDKDAVKHEANIKKLERIGDSVFNSMLGVSDQCRRDDGTLEKGIFFLMLNERTLETHNILNPEQLKIHLERSIYGETVLEQINLNKLKPPLHIGGTDASIQPIDISQILPWHIDQNEMYIVTSVGVKYDIFERVREIDRYPEPSHLAEYSRERAIEEGLLIPPAGTLGYRAEMQDRIKEAAMDLRQYRKDFEMMFQKTPPVKIHFRDGRLFPMEHYFGDAVHFGVHGEMVRTSLGAFRNLVNIIGASNGDVKYLGFVKRPGLHLIAPLVMWYIGFGSGKNGSPSIDPEMDLSDYFKSLRSETYVVNWLFAGLKDNHKNNSVFVTFRLVRRFQSMEENFIQQYEPSPDRNRWKKRLEESRKIYIGEASNDIGVDIISDLCARSAVVQFYCSFNRDPEFESQLVLPRIEFLLPYPDFEEIFKDPNKVSTKISEYVSSIVDTMFHPGVLEQYPDSLFPFTNAQKELFISPLPVNVAHTTSKDIAKIYRDDFIELLIKEARLYWIQKTQ